MTDQNPQTGPDGGGRSGRDELSERPLTVDTKNAVTPWPAGTVVTLLALVLLSVVREGPDRVQRASGPKPDRFQFLREHQRKVLLVVGLGCAGLAVLMAAGLFWKDGLDLSRPAGWEGTDNVRWPVVIVLALVALVSFLVREYTAFKEVALGVVVWGGAALSYLVVGALVLWPTSAQKMGLDDDLARSRGLGVVTVVFFLLAAVLVLKSEREETEPTLSLTSILSLRTSPGSSVIFLWSLVIAYALGVIAGTVILDGLDGGSETQASFECNDPPITAENCVQKGVWPSYLILLAVPGAAAAAAKMSEKEKKTPGQLAARTLGDAKTLAKNQLNATAGATVVLPSADDEEKAAAAAAEKSALTRSQELLEEAAAVADPGDPASTTTAISDIQYFVFNVFAMFYVLSSLIPFGRLLAVPELLLALSGASALVYTVNRATTP